MRNKSDSESRIITFVQQIKNQLRITPAFLHCNRGGEFGSAKLISFLKSRGISLKQGPGNSPQTNGLAERFNQTIITKIRCVLAQSAVPISHWDEAACYSSTLINLLPSKAIKWASPVHVFRPTSSKVLPCSAPLLFLGYESHSDAGRFLNPLKKNVVISRDFTPPRAIFDYGNPLASRKPLTSLPNKDSTVTSPKTRVVSLPLQCPSKKVSPPGQQDQTELGASSEAAGVHLPAANNPSAPAPAIDPKDPPPKHHVYVPYFSKAPKDITSSLDTSAVLPARTRSAVILGKEAFKDPGERELWLESMAGENLSLLNRNTGTLVPPPDDNVVIGGMWHLVRKKK